MMTYKQLQDLMDKAWELAKEEGLSDNDAHYRQGEIFEELGGDLEDYDIVVVNELPIEEFCAIAQYVLEQGPYDGSTKDIFKMALCTYEDEHGEITEEEADYLYKVFEEMLNTMEVA